MSASRISLISVYMLYFKWISLRIASVSVGFRFSGFVLGVYFCDWAPNIAIISAFEGSFLTGVFLDFFEPTDFRENEDLVPIEEFLLSTGCSSYDAKENGFESLLLEGIVLIKPS